MKVLKNDWSSEIEKELQCIPKGHVVVEKFLPHETESTLLANHFDTCSDGKGKMKTFSVFPGIELSFNYYYANKFIFHHDSLDSVMQINYCRHGRIGWAMKDGLTIYIGPGDLSLHMMNCCADSEMNLSLGYYEGVSISIDLNQLTENTPEILRDAEITGQQLYQKFCQQDKPTALPANDKIEHIFSELYDLPENMRLAKAFKDVFELLPTEYRKQYHS